MFEFFPGLSALFIFYILATTARLLLEKLDERMKDIVEKSNDGDPDGDDDELGLSVEFDEWRCQYELVSRWIDRLDSYFGFLILAELASFSLFSFYYFWKLLLTYVAVAIHMQYDAFAVAAHAIEIERLIGRPLLGGFPLGDHHISNAMFFCKFHHEMLRNMSCFTAHQAIGWLRLLIILISVYRLQNQVLYRSLQHT